MSDKSSKDWIIEAIKEKQALLRSVNSELTKLRQARASLNRVDTSVDYVLKGGDYIKVTYFLGGNTYFEQATEEQTLLDNVERDFSTHKSNVLSSLAQKISELEADQTALETSIRHLTDLLMSE